MWRRLSRRQSVAQGEHHCSCAVIEVLELWVTVAEERGQKMARRDGALFIPLASLSQLFKRFYIRNFSRLSNPENHDGIESENARQVPDMRIAMIVTSLPTCGFAVESSSCQAVPWNAFHSRAAHWRRLPSRAAVRHHTLSWRSSRTLRHSKTADHCPTPLTLARNSEWGTRRQRFLTSSPRPPE